MTFRKMYVSKYARCSWNPGGTFRKRPNPGNSFLTRIWSVNTLMMSSKTPSSMALLVFAVASLFFGDMTWFRRMGAGAEGGDCEVTRIKDDGRRRGVPRPGLADSG